METGVFLKTVSETVTPRGTAALWWLGQMGFWIKMGDTVVSVDYYAAPDADRRVAPPVPAEEVTGISLFFGTHDHIDHIDHYAWRIWAETCPHAQFVLPSFCIPSVAGDGIPESRLIGMNDGDVVRIGPLTVRAVAAAHEFLDRDGKTGLYPALQYILEGNGVRVYHAGDTVRYEGMLPKLRETGPFDAAVLPINGRDGRRYRNNCIGNMTFQEAADLAGLLKVGTVLPGHWDMFAMNSADPEEFADYLDAKYGGAVRCVIPDYQKTVMIGE
jgi:L-ascorbate metabolism protein UlaG (beta-lactamase superfamily)